MSLGPIPITAPLDPQRPELGAVDHCGCTLCTAAQMGENERARRENREPRNVTEIVTPPR
jgi:3'-phosphoadenosine 5'-phosphosulfate sulfotransferase (PAPS reductase)/FAD synthetase